MSVKGDRRTQPTRPAVARVRLEVWLNPEDKAKLDSLAFRLRETRRTVIAAALIQYEIWLERESS